MPDKVFDFGAASATATATEQMVQQVVGATRNNGWMQASGIGLLSGGLSGITATNGKPMEAYNLTLEDVRKMADSMPKPVGTSLRIAVHDQQPLGAAAATFSVTVPNINYVDIPMSVIYTAAANTVATVTIPDSAFAYQAYLNNAYQTMMSGMVFSSYGGVQTPEQRAARVKAEAERAEKRTNAIKRAEGLLFTILRPEQVRQYEDGGYFETEVDDRIYRIHKRSHSGNVELIVNGKAIARYCAHPKNCYETPEVDTMITQLLMLRTDEQKFLKTANKTVLM